MPIETLTDALEYYRGFAIGVENRSQSTIRFKEAPLRQLILYVDRDLPLQDIQEQHIIGFMEWLRQRSKNEHHPSGNKAGGKVSDITINTYFRGLRAFFNWLVKRGTLLKSPMSEADTEPITLLFEEKLEEKSLWDLRSLLAHGTLDALDETQRERIRQRVWDAESIARKYILMVLRKALGIQLFREKIIGSLFIGIENMILSREDMYRGPTYMAVLYS